MGWIKSNLINSVKVFIGLVVEKDSASKAEFKSFLALEKSAKAQVKSATLRGILKYIEYKQLKLYPV